MAMRFENDNVRDLVYQDIQNKQDVPDFLNNVQVSDITDLSQIIDPYELVQSYLSDNSTEGRAKYLHYLEQAKGIQQMQMAAYQNWYNSDEQVAARKRAAGLNPDLLGTDAAAAVGASAPEGSGISSLPTSELTSLQNVQTLATVVQGIASVAGLASSFAGIFKVYKELKNLETTNQILQNQSTEGQLRNISAAESLFTSGIAGRLASAISASGESFDFESWFADPANTAGIFDAYSAQDTPQMRAIFSNVLAHERESIMAHALDINKRRASTQTDYASFLADPRYSPDMKLQSAYMRPLMEQKVKLDEAVLKYQNALKSYELEYINGLDAVKAANAANDIAVAQSAESDYQAQYFSSMDAKKKAAFEELQRQVDTIRLNLQNSIWSNLQDAYNSNPLSPLGLSASYMCLNNSHLDLTQWLLANGLSALPIPFPVDTSNVDNFGNNPDNYPRKYFWEDEEAYTRRLVRDGHLPPYALDAWN